MCWQRSGNALAFWAAALDSCPKPPDFESWVHPNVMGRELDLGLVHIIRRVYFGEFCRQGAADSLVWIRMFQPFRWYQVTPP